MHFEPEAVPAEMNALLSRFISITGMEPWEKRIRSLRTQIESNPFWEEYAEDRFALEIEMSRYLDRRRSSGNKMRLPSTFLETALLSFIAMVARVHQRLNEVGKKQLAGRLRDCLKSDAGLGPLQFELSVASQFMAREFDVDFSDLEGREKFDFLVRRESIEMEVECKNVSGDLGRKIHQRHLRELSSLIQPAVARALDERTGGQFVRLTLPQRLLPRTEFLIDVASNVKLALEEQGSFHPPSSFSCEYGQFPFEGTPFDTPDPENLRHEEAEAFVETLLNVENTNVLMNFRPGHGVVLVVIESEQPDSVIGALSRELRRAAKDQVSKKLPAILCVRFMDVSEKDLENIAEMQSSDRPSSLQMLINELLDRPDWAHIYMVAFFAKGGLRRTQSRRDQVVTTSIRESGLVYYFRNSNNALYHIEDFSLF